MRAPFARRLDGGEVGRDVEGLGRALCHAGVYMPLLAFHRGKTSWKRTYGDGKKKAVNKIRKAQGRKQTGVYDQDVLDWLNTHCMGDKAGKGPGCFDALAVNLISSWIPMLVHPVPSGFSYQLCQGVHETGGLPGNYAYDWCAGPGTPILAVAECVIRKLSGSAPSQDHADAGGTFGWSIHYETKGGYRWFWTHFGRRANIGEGQTVPVGRILGWVGDQAYRPDHIHGGVTSPYGAKDAREMLGDVEAARHIPAVPV